MTEPINWKEKWEGIKSTIPVYEILEKAKKFSNVEFTCLRALEKEFDIDGNGYDMEFFVTNFENW